MVMVKVQNSSAGKAVKVRSGYMQVSGETIGGE